LHKVLKRLRPLLKINGVTYMKQSLNTLKCGKITINHGFTHVFQEQYDQITQY